MRRLQINLNHDSWTEVHRLKCKLCINRDVDLFRHSLSLLNTLIERADQKAVLYFETAAGRQKAFDVRELVGTLQPTKEQKRRFQVDVSQDVYDEVDRLREHLHLSTLSALFRHALYVLKRVVDEKSVGHNLGMDLNGKTYLVEFLSEIGARGRSEPVKKSSRI